MIWNSTSNHHRFIPWTAAVLLLPIIAGCDRCDRIVSDDLFASGMLDSMGIVQLMAFIEKEYAISIDKNDMAEENFKDINSIKNFIERKKKA